MHKFHPSEKSDMETKLEFEYDRQGDILYINKHTPYAEQDSEEIEYGVVARLNPATREIENLEILFKTSSRKSTA